MDSGMRVHYLCGSRLADLPPGAMRLDRANGSVVTRVGLRRGRIDRVNRFSLERRIRALLVDLGVDLVHIHSASELSRPVSSAAREAGVPVVVTLHDGLWACANYCFEDSRTKRLCRSSNPFRCFVCRALELSQSASLLRLPRLALRAAAETLQTYAIARGTLRRMDRVIGCCGYVARQYRRMGVRCEIGVIANLLPDGLLRFKRVSRPARPLRVGVLGAFRDHKGGEVVLRALALLEGRFSEFVLGIWGPAPSPTALRAVPSLARAPIELHGPYDRSALGEIFSSIDLMVHASTWDTYPTVVLEALASRTPVLAVRATGSVEAVREGTNGLFFERNDANDLAARLSWILDHPKELERMQQRMHPLPPFETMSSAYAREYRRLLSKRAEGRERSLSRGLRGERRGEDRGGGSA